MLHATFNTTWLLTIALLTIRLVIVLYASPLDVLGRIPGQIRLFFSFAIAALLYISVDNATIILPSTSIELILMMLNEVVLGIALALAVHCAFAVFDVAGRLIDFQSGLSAASVLNPATNTFEALFGAIFLLLASFIFFLSDGHHLFLEGLMFSVQKIPPGHWLGTLCLPVIMYDLGLMFSLGLVLAAPVLACLLLMDAGIAVMARTMPQMNVYFLFLPLKVFIALAITAMTLKYISPLFLQVFTSLFQSWDTTMTMRR